MELDSNSKQILIDSLNMHMCWIETGTTTMRITDALIFNESVKLTYSRIQPIPIRNLDQTQEQLVKQMENLVHQLVRTR